MGTEYSSRVLNPELVGRLACPQCKAISTAGDAPFSQHGKGHSQEAPQATRPPACDMMGRVVMRMKVVRPGLPGAITSATFGGQEATGHEKWRLPVGWSSGSSVTQVFGHAQDLRAS
jgi:hypothetical protein